MTYKEAMDILEDNNNFLNNNYDEYGRYSDGFDALETIREYFDKYRWHSLNDDPEDLPDHTCDCIVGYDEGRGLNYKTRKSRVDISKYNHGVKTFNKDNHYHKVIAWRYIEPFEEGDDNGERITGI